MQIKKFSLYIIAVFVAYTILGGCGVKGDLYRPEGSINDFEADHIEE